MIYETGIQFAIPNLDKINIKQKAYENNHFGHYSVMSQPIGHSTKQRKKEFEKKYGALVKEIMNVREQRITRKPKS